MNISNPRTLIYSAVVAALAVNSTPVNAQDEESMANALEEVIVTATRREESLQDVPISVATLSDMRLDSLFNGGEDVLALSGRVPGFYA